VSALLPASGLVDSRDARSVVEVPAEVPFVDLRAGYEQRKPAIDRALHEVLDRCDFILGEAVDAFESAFAAFCGTRHAIGVDSGTSALELMLRAYDIGPGDEVITAANTFVATVAAIDAVGATPVLVDVTETTYTIDPGLVRAAVTSTTKAIIAVHLYGQPVDMRPINAVAAEHGLYVFEDACQAHGSTYHGRRAGSLGDAAAFSFYPSKNLGGFGDGGMVTLDDDDAAARLRELRNLGSSSKYRHTTKGFNRRLDTLHAAVLAVKLRHLDEDNAARRRASRSYDTLLDQLPVDTPRVRDDAEHVYHLYVIEVDDRDRLREHLDSDAIRTGIHYPVPVHLQEAYRSLGYGPGAFPVTERAAGRILSLPMFPTISDSAIERTTNAIRQFHDDRSHG
jgi:dTDP-4-amino-4,6-dideoxygalactose transaminase